MDNEQCVYLGNIYHNKCDLGYKNCNKKGDLRAGKGNPMNRGHKTKRTRCPMFRTGLPLEVNITHE